MLDFLYALIIAPLRGGMQGVLEWAYALTGSYGVSIILLSVAVNIALIPVYHLAESWQEDERALQKAMAAKLADIKAVFRGRERYMLTRGLYRVHGYHPLLALRTSLGLLIQIPFFFAAYNLLHNNPELQGISFFFIRNLGLPDALLHLGAYSVNLLPFVMTAVNLLSAAVYSTRLGRRDKIQLYALAALFLILLYNAAAALLLYWTCNNIASCLKNIIYKRYVYTDSTHGTPQCVLLLRSGLARLRLALYFLLRRLPAKADLACMLLAVAAFAVAETVFAKQTVFSLMLASTLASATAVFGRGVALGRGRDEARKDLLYIAVVFGLLVFAALWCLTAEKKLGTPAWWRYSRLYALNFGFISAWLVMRQPLLPLFSTMARAGLAKLGNKTGGAYMAAALVIGTLIFVYTPCNLYASDPEFFTQSLGSLLGGLGFRFLVFLGLVWLVYRYAPAFGRGFLALFFMWAAFGMMLYTFVFTGDYGGMDQIFLRNPNALRTRLVPLVDFGVICIGAALVYLLYKKARAKTFAGLMQGLCLVLVGISTAYIVAAPAQLPKVEHGVQLPEYSERMWSFSQTGQNVFVLMLDGFTGGDMHFILQWEPELRERLEGFTWYPDTVSPGTGTMLSIPGMLGGEQYHSWRINQRVQELNARPGAAKTDLLEEMHKAYAVLPNLLHPRNFDMALGDVVYLQPERLAPHFTGMNDLVIAGASLHAAYAPLWRQLRGLPEIPSPSRTSFLAAAGAFQAAPWVMRVNLYNGGSWMKTQQATRNSDGEGHAALLDMLPVISNTRPVKANTFKFISVEAKHMPLMDTATGLPADPANPEAYTRAASRPVLQAAEHFSMQAIARMVQWMKQNKVYDNSLIVVMSDHSTGHNAYLPKELNKALESETEGATWKPHALLLVKPPHSRGPLRIDDRFMAGSDLPAIICDSIGAPAPGNAVNPLQATPEWLQNRTRTFASGWSSIRRHEKDRFNVKVYDVQGSMFNLNSWKLRSNGE